MLLFKPVRPHIFNVFMYRVQPLIFWVALPLPFAEEARSTFFMDKWIGPKPVRQQISNLTPNLFDFWSRKNIFLKLFKIDVSTNTQTTFKNGKKYLGLYCLY